MMTMVDSGEDEMEWEALLLLLLLMEERCQEDVSLCFDPLGCWTCLCSKTLRPLVGCCCCCCRCCQSQKAKKSRRLLLSLLMPLLMLSETQNRLPQSEAGRVW